MFNVEGVAKVIADARNSIGVSQRQMDNELGLTGAGMKKFESDLAHKYVEFLKVLAVLDLTPMDFMTREDWEDAEECYGRLKQLGKKNKNHLALKIAR